VAADRARRRTPDDIGGAATRNGVPESLTPQAEAIPPARADPNTRRTSAILGRLVPYQTSLNRTNPACGTMQQVRRAGKDHGSNHRKARGDNFPSSGRQRISPNGTGEIKFLSIKAATANRFLCDLCAPLCGLCV